VKNSEKDLFKTAKIASKLSKKSDITGLIEKDRDEAELRNKLVSKLKEKELEKIKASDEKLRDNTFYSDNESREDISDDEPIKDKDFKDKISKAFKDDQQEDRILSSEEDELDEVSEDDLRLTASTEDDEEGNGTEERKKKKKKEKKKKKKKEKEKERDREKDKKREERKKQRELENFTTLAQRIADRDRRSRSPRDRDRRDHRRERSRTPEKRKDKIPESWDRRERTREDEARQRQLERLQKVRESQLRSRLEAKRKEQSMDEMYDQMVNGGGGYRKLKRGEHYEDVQNQLLANEIRIKERREKYDRERHREQDYGVDPRDPGYRRQKKFLEQQYGRKDDSYRPYRR